MLIYNPYLPSDLYLSKVKEINISMITMLSHKWQVNLELIRFVAVIMTRIFAVEQFTKASTKLTQLHVLTMLRDTC